jgi:hypothetical protein
VRADSIAKCAIRQLDSPFGEAAGKFSSTKLAELRSSEWSRECGCGVWSYKRFAPKRGEAAHQNKFLVAVRSGVNGRGRFWIGTIGNMLQRRFIIEIENQTVKFDFEPLKKYFLIPYHGPKVFICVPGAKLLVEYVTSAPFKNVHLLFKRFALRYEIGGGIITDVFEFERFHIVVERPDPVQERLFGLYDHQAAIDFSHA